MRKMLLYTKTVLMLVAVKMPMDFTAAFDCNSTLEDMIPTWNEIKGNWSCEHRCGETYEQRPCACDDLCQLFNDCCDDFIIFCTPLVAVAVNTTTGVNDAVGSQSADSTAQGGVQEAVYPPPTGQVPLQTSSAVSFDNATRPDADVELARVQEQTAEGIADQAIATTAATQSSIAKNTAAGKLVFSGTETTPPVDTDNFTSTKAAMTVASDEHRAEKITTTTPASRSAEWDDSQTVNDRGEITTATTTTTTSVDGDGVGGASAPNRNTVRSVHLMGKVRCRHRTRLVAACPRPAATLPSPLYYGGQSIRQQQLVSSCETPPGLARDVDVAQLLPVTDTASGFHFANVYCLLCHGGKVKNSNPWGLAFIWIFGRLKTVQQPQDILNYLLLARELQTVTIAAPPTGVIPRRCFPTSSFYPVICKCPHLLRLCETEPASFITFGLRPFRNWHCFKCYILHTHERLTDADAKNIKASVTESIGAPKFYEFVNLMTWVSQPVGGVTASVRLSTDEGAARSFTWRQVTCDLKDRAGNVSSKRDSWREEQHSGTGDLKKQTGGEAPEFSTKDPGITDRENASFAKAEQVDNTEFLDVNFSDTTALFTAQCRVDTCISGVVKMNGDCSRDLVYRYRALFLTCLPAVEYFTNDKLPVATYSPSLILVAKFNHLLQRILKEQLINTTLRRAYVSRSLDDDCFWNITVHTIEPKVISETQTSLKFNLTYAVFLDVMQEMLNQVNMDLYVCGIRLWQQYVKPDALSYCFFNALAPLRDPASTGDQIQVDIVLIHMAVVIVMALLTAGAR